MFLTLTRQWRYLSRPLAWLLVPLGQKSLNAFTAHVVVVALVALALMPFGLAESSPWWLNAIIQVVSIVLIWVLVRRRVLEPTPKTQPIWRASPIAAAILVVVIFHWIPAPTTSAAMTTVSDAVLARARAYGTPIVSLDRSAAAPVSEAVLARARAYGTPIVSLERSDGGAGSSRRAESHRTSGGCTKSSSGRGGRASSISRIDSSTRICSCARGAPARSHTACADDLCAG